MQSNRKIPWPRLLADGAVIVVSILLAFGIDAWWEGKRERDFELSALQSLRSDFVASRKSLVLHIRRYEELRTNFAHFQSATQTELEATELGAIGDLVLSLTASATFDPITSTLDALAGDGRLGLISDPEIREHLSMWLQGLDDIEENSFDLRSGALRVQMAMEAHGGPFFSSYLSENDLTVVPRADGATLSVLRRDTDFMGKARSHQYILSAYLIELRNLLEILDSNLASLDKSASQD